MAGATSRHYGLAGVVCDGCSRDIDEFKVLGLPVFGKGFVHQSVRGRVGYDGHNIPVRIGENAVNPGDFIIGDENGVVVVPKDRHHRFLLTEARTIRCVRLFRDRQGWVPHYRAPRP